VVLRATSSAWLPPDQGWELHLGSAPRLGLGAVRVRVSTRWEGTEENAVPRELIVEIRGRAGSLDEAARKFPEIASPIVTMIGFTANVKVGQPEIHLAYECTADAAERPFLEVFLPDEHGPVTGGRTIRADLLEAACAAFFNLQHENGNVGRALRQYELALRCWYLGGEWLALSHLYIAVEALTDPMLRKARADRGFASTAEFARSFGIEIEGPDHGRKRDAFRGRIREQLIFGGDRDTYQTAKRASDGLEHGHLELDEVARHAIKCTDMTFHHVRRTVIKLLQLPGDVAAGLMAVQPRDVQSVRKVIRGRLIGLAENPAPEGSPYPYLEWTSRVASVTRSTTEFQFNDTETFTLRTHPDVRFQPDQFIAIGRLEDGHAPVHVANSTIAMTGPTPEPKSVKLLATVMPLVTAASTGPAENRIPFPLMFASNLFGQGIASFEAAQLLISNRRPVEALPVLRNLVLVASRFEQMTHKDGPGTGIVLRMALDMLKEVGAVEQVAARHSKQILDSAAVIGISVPQELPAPDTTGVYASLAQEMRLADSAVNGTYATTGPHLEFENPEHLAFRTQLDPGPFTELIASACVIAELELLKNAAQVLGWEVDKQEIDRLLGRARELNEESANPEPSPGPVIEDE